MVGKNFEGQSNKIWGGRLGLLRAYMQRKEFLEKQIIKLTFDVGIINKKIEDLRKEMNERKRK